jgi:hypothetical protein
MDTLLTWILPILLVSMLIWTVWMWSRLDYAQRWIAVIPLVIIAYAIVSPNNSSKRRQNLL